jgi:hypothetical protein
VLPGVSGKGTSYLGRFHFLLKLIDLVSRPNGFPVNGILEPFDHGFQM